MGHSEAGAFAFHYPRAMQALMALFLAAYAILIVAGVIYLIAGTW